MTAFAAAVRHHRLALGWNQRRLAREALCHPSVISRCEAGTRPPSLALADALDHALGTGTALTRLLIHTRQPSTVNVLGVVDAQAQPKYTDTDYTTRLLLRDVILDDHAISEPLPCLIVGPAALGAATLPAGTRVLGWGRLRARTTATAAIELLTHEIGPSVHQ